MKCLKYTINMSTRNIQKWITIYMFNSKININITEYSIIIYSTEYSTEYSIIYSTEYSIA